MNSYLGICQKSYLSDSCLQFSAQFLILPRFCPLIVFAAGSLKVCPAHFDYQILSAHVHMEIIEPL